jgi:hypothetical protein
MDSFDHFFHRLHCSLHPQLRHYSPNALSDPADYWHELDYWNLPESFRKECNAAFQATKTSAYFSWEEKCVFSFSTLTPPCPHAALLRNIFVPKPHRGHHYCTQALEQIVRVAESSAVCILAIVHPFEIHSEGCSIDDAIDALHRSAHGISYVSDEAATQAMNTRLKKAGFRNCNLLDSMSDHGIATIPLTHQWLFVPRKVDKSFLAGIAGRFVSEAVDDAAANQTAA